MTAPDRILIQDKASSDWPDGDWINADKYDRPEDLGYTIEYIRRGAFPVERIKRAEKVAASKYGVEYAKLLRDILTLLEQEESP